MIENSRIDPARVQQEQEEGRKAGIAFATYDPGDGDLWSCGSFSNRPATAILPRTCSRTIRTSAMASLPTASLATRKPSHPTISFWRSPGPRSRR